MRNETESSPNLYWLICVAVVALLYVINFVAGTHV